MGSRGKVSLARSIDRFILQTVTTFAIVILTSGITALILYSQLSVRAASGHVVNRVKATSASSPKPQVSNPEIIPNYSLPPDENGLAPVLTQVPTKLPVVYLTIDDGANKTQEEVDLLAKNGIKASLFLSDLFIHSDPDFFTAITKQGSVIENHTLSHDISLVDRSYDEQKQEICGMSDRLDQYYGKRPTLFRPPGGAYSDSMRKAAADCGMKAVVDWHAKVNGGAMQYQEGDSLQPGDIVLMHFRPEFAQDLAAFIAAKNAAGLHTQLLETVTDR